MKLMGLQKLTLLDYPETIACTVFVGGCNLRCPFCHNSGLLDGDETPDALDPEAFLAFLRRRRGVLDGVCISGGEPLLHPETAELARAVKALGYLVKLDTNGCFPDRLEQWIEEGLADYVAMDLKNAPRKYAQTAGLARLDLKPIERSVALLLSGRVGYEFRTTVVRQLHTAEDFSDIGAWIQGAERYYLQSFVDSDAVLRPGLTACPPQELRKFCDLVRPFVQFVAVRGI